MSSARWAVPASRTVGSIAIRTFGRQAPKLFLGFPFFPSSFTVAEDKEIWSMPYPEFSAGRGLISQFDWCRLIVVLANRGVVFHFVDASQFNAVTLELNGRSHFLTGITATDVGGTSSNLARRG